MEIISDNFEKAAHFFKITYIKVKDAEEAIKDKTKIKLDRELTEKMSLVSENLKQYVRYRN